MKFTLDVHDRFFKLILGFLLLIFLYGIDFSLIVGSESYKFSLIRVTTPLFCELFFTAEIVFLVAIKILLKPWFSENFHWLLFNKSSYAYCLPTIFGIFSWKLYYMNVLAEKYPKIHLGFSYLVHVILPFIGALCFFIYIPMPHKYFYPLIWLAPIFIYYFKHYKGIKNNFLAAILSCIVSHCTGDLILILTNPEKYIEKNWSYVFPTYIFMIILFAIGMYGVNLIVIQNKDRFLSKMHKKPNN